MHIVVDSAEPREAEPLVIRRRRWRPTIRYLSQTEVHVYALSIGASVLLSFFPFLIVMLIIYANMATSAVPIGRDGIEVSSEDPEASTIRPITDDLDLPRIYQGIASLLGYAVLAVYLNSPAMRRDFKR